MADSDAAVSWIDGELYGRGASGGIINGDGASSFVLMHWFES